MIVERDLDLVRAGVERWLGHRVRSLERPTTGYSCETIIVDRELVLRLPPAGAGIFPSYDLAAQASAQEAAGRHGVPVAAPCRVEPDRSFLGTEFAAMPFIAGAIPSEATRADPWLRGLADDVCRRAVWEGFVDLLAGIHGAPTKGLSLRSGLAAELEFWESYARWATGGSPPSGLSRVIGWCRDHVPVNEPPAGLLWGDVRFGNVIFDPESLRPAAVLDWDMASIGPLELDLGWFLALEQVQADFLPDQLGGFGDRGETTRRVEASLGRPLRDLPWYEVFALARASAIATRISMLQQQSGRQPMNAPDRDPMIAVALRTIDRGL